MAMKKYIVLFSLLSFLFLAVANASASPVDVAIWNFEDSNLIVDSLDPLVPTATLAAGSGLSSPTYEAGNPPTPPQALEYSSWSTSGCGADQYLEFTLDMSNIGGLSIRFDEIRSATGPTRYEIHYSVNGGSFNLLSGGTSTTSSGYGPNPMHTHQVTPGSADDLAMRGQSNVRFRVYACDSGGAGGKWRIDNLAFQATTSPTAIELKDLTASSHNTNSWYPLLSILIFFLLIPLLGILIHRAGKPS